MGKAAFTKGPWTADQIVGAVRINTPLGTICELHHLGWLPDAYLIATAPTLYAEGEQSALTLEEAASRDYSEIENLEKGGPIVMADWTIQNIGTKEEFLTEVDRIINKVVS